MKIKNKTPLSEITRWEIIRRSQREASGYTNKKGEFVDGRWQKKQLYHAKDMNNVDFAKLFETDTFIWSSRVGDYIVTVSFEGAFSNLYDTVRGWGGKNRYKRITLKMLTQCLSKALDTEDLYVNCTCPDLRYRFSYWLTQADAKFGTPENRPPKVRNVKNNKGYVCKHLLSVLYGKRWVPAAARAWYNFIQANPELAEEMIWG